MFGALVAAIPSPSSGSLHIGGLQLRAYGLMIALGVFAAVWLAQKRHVARGGDPDDFTNIAMWAVPAGLIGARLYHVITDWRSFEGRWFDVIKIWQGGLGIPGGLIAGITVGVWAANRRGLDLREALDVTAPVLPLAQAIGRVGNWWNQELFGKPTSLPWGLKIDLAHRPPGYLAYETFQPTFLYEALWNLALCGFLIWLDRRRVVPKGRLIAVYVTGYGIGRLWVELLRIDQASHIFGVRVNVWVACLAIIGGLVALFWPRHDRPAGAEVEPAHPVGDATSVDEDESGAVSDPLAGGVSHGSPVEPS
jgi:prolipoprotein diacylglyceryl transferase